MKQTIILCLWMLIAGSLMADPVSEPDAGNSQNGGVDFPALLNKDCQNCHSRSGMQPKIQKNGIVTDYYIGLQQFQESAHFKAGKTECTFCHSQGVKEFPHVNVQLPSCLDCHDDRQTLFRDITEATKQSVHFKNHQKTMDCSICHNPHYMTTLSRMSQVEKNSGCMQCHSTRLALYGQTLETVHAWHPLATLHLSRMACIGCHTSPEAATTAFKHNILPKQQAIRQCEECHTSQGRLFSHYAGDYGVYSQSVLSDSQSTGQEYKSPYVAGSSTRKPWLDYSGLFLLFLVLAGAVTHALLRILWKGKRNE